jgi:hypothetical protein
MGICCCRKNQGFFFCLWKKKQKDFCYLGFAAQAPCRCKLYHCGNERCGCGSAQGYAESGNEDRFQCFALNSWLPCRRPGEVSSSDPTSPLNLVSLTLRGASGTCGGDDRDKLIQQNKRAVASPQTAAYSLYPATGFCLQRFSAERGFRELSVRRFQRKQSIRLGACPLPSRGSVLGELCP